MNATRRREVAELAAALHPLMTRAAQLHREESKAAPSVIVEAEPYNAVRELGIVVASLEQTLDMLVSLPTIGAPR